jgi:hypothetical protein
MLKFSEWLLLESMTVDSDGDGNIAHYHKIGRHLVRVGFDKSHTMPGHYNVDFQVNFSHHHDPDDRRPKIEPEHAQKILQHVAASIHHFKQEHLPKSIGFNANEPSKVSLYSKFAQSIAKRYRANHTTSKVPYSEHEKHHINFKQGSRPFEENVDPFAGSDLLTEELEPIMPHREDPNFLIHRQVVGKDKHMVRTTFAKTEDGNHHVDFEVNGSYMKNGIRPGSGREILHHVASVVHKYKAEHNPSAFRFSGAGKKGKVYSAFAKHLANHYGGKAEEIDGMAGVKFHK